MGGKNIRAIERSKGSTLIIIINRSPIHKPCFEYQWGRKDCHTAPSNDANFEFPAGWMTSPQLFSFFKRMFHFSKEEVGTFLKPLENCLNLRVAMEDAEHLASCYEGVNGIIPLVGERKGLTLSFTRSSCERLWSSICRKQNWLWVTNTPDFWKCPDYFILCQFYENKKK